MSWRRVNRGQVVLIPLLAVFIMATDLRNAVWVVQALSLWALWLGAMAAWRSDENPPQEED